MVALLAVIAEVATLVTDEVVDCLCRLCPDRESADCDVGLPPPPSNTELIYPLTPPPSDE